MIVYTAIFGNYDTLSYPPEAPPGTRFVCYTDNLTRACRGWEMRRVTCSMSPRLCARFHKALAHVFFPDEEITLWHGGNVKLRGDLAALSTLLQENDIAVVKHSERDCIYDEAAACARWHLDRPETIQRQIEGYRLQGYPEHRGLNAAFLVLRRNTPRIQRLNELWWSEIEQGSVRDQISFDYCCWKLGITPATVPGTIFAGPNFTRNGAHK